MESHLANPGLIKLLYSIPAYKCVAFEIGARVCCNHFQRHISCLPTAKLEACEFVDHFQHVLQVPRRRRKRKREEVATSAFSPIDPLESQPPATNKIYELWSSHISSISSVFGDWLSQFWSISDDAFSVQNLDLSAVPPQPSDDIFIGRVAVDQIPMDFMTDAPELRQENLALKQQLETAHNMIVQIQARNRNLMAEVHRLELVLDEMSGFTSFWNQKSDLFRKSEVDGHGSEAHKLYQDFMRGWTGLLNADRVIASFAEKIPKSQTGRPSAFGPEQWSALFLIYLRMGCTKKWMSQFARCPKETVRDNFTLLLNRFQDWSLEHFTLPSIAKWTEATPEDFKEEFPNTLSFFVDGTVIPIYKPSNNTAQKKAYNAKHGHHALTFTILVTSDGRIVWLSQIDLGNMHDSTAWNSSGACIALIEKYGNTSTVWPKTAEAPQFIIGGDKAYPRIHVPGGWKVVVTKTAQDNEGQNIRFLAHGLPPVQTSNTDWTKYHIADNTSSVISGTIARWRSIVERTFAVVKNWKILANKNATSPTDRKESEKLIRVVCALANISMGFTAGDNQ
jgi:hypothetical protein